MLSIFYSVSGCVSEDFDDYMNYWKHNGSWIFDSPEIIKNLAAQNSIQIEGASLFYYEAHETEFDGERWHPWSPEPSFPTNVTVPSTKQLEGFDVVTFYARNLPEHSPLSCDSLAEQLPRNAHCLLDSFDEAETNLSNGAFNKSETARTGYFRYLP